MSAKRLSRRKSRSCGGLQGCPALRCKKKGQWAFCPVGHTLILTWKMRVSLDLGIACSGLGAVFELHGLTCRALNVLQELLPGPARVLPFPGMFGVGKPTGRRRLPTQPLRCPGLPNPPAEGRCRRCQWRPCQCHRRWT